MSADLKAASGAAFAAAVAAASFGASFGASVVVAFGTDFGGGAGATLDGRWWWFGWCWLWPIFICGAIVVVFFRWVQEWFPLCLNFAFADMISPQAGM